jgi:transcriptional regulator with XRE-family HTH domain
VDQMPQGRESSSARASEFGCDMRVEQISTIFGQVLREQRIARELSQEELALAADVDRTFVSQMERGIRQPTITTLMKLAGALGIQPSTLVVRMEKLLR